MRFGLSSHEIEQAGSFLNLDFFLRWGRPKELMISVQNLDREARIRVRYLTPPIFFPLFFLAVPLWLGTLKLKA